MNQDPVPTVLGCVQQQPGRAVVVSYQNVNSTVVVHIAEHGGAAHLLKLQSRASQSGDVLKTFAFPQVAKHEISLAVRIRIAWPGGWYSENGSVGAEHVQEPAILNIQKAYSETRKRQGR